MAQFVSFPCWNSSKNKNYPTQLLFVILANLFIAGNVIGVGPKPLTCTDFADSVIVSSDTDLKAVVELSENGPGTTFCLLSGVHRVTESVILQNGDTFVGENGAVINGAILLSDWKSDQPGVWKTDVAKGISKEKNKDDKSGKIRQSSDGNVNSEYIYFDDEMLSWAPNVSRVTASSFHINYQTDTVYIGRKPAGSKIELGQTPDLFTGTASDVTIQNLVFEKFATPAGKDTAIINPANENAKRWTIESNEFRLNHGRCVKGGPSGSENGNGAVINNNYFHHNGFQAIGGSNDNGVISNNEVAYSNQLEFVFAWAGAALKAGTTSNGIWENNYVHDNEGNGIWIDVHSGLNGRNIIRNNRVVNNRVNGIHYENSENARIQGNWCEGNGSLEFSTPKGAGILISSSTNVEIVGNTVLGNHTAITAKSNTRRGNVDGIKVTNNVIALQPLKRGQVGFWGNDPPPSRPSGRWVNLPKWNNNTYILADDTATNWHVGTERHSFTTWPYDASSKITPMVATFREVQTGGSSNSNTINSTPISAVTNNLYLAAISRRQFVEVDSVAGLGLNWTRVASQCSGRSQVGLEVWMAIGDPDRSGSVTATWTENFSNAVIVVSRYSGVNVNAPIGNVITANTLGIDGACSDGSNRNSYNVMLPGVADGSTVYSAVGLQKNRTHTGGAGYLERAKINHGNKWRNKASVAIQDQMISSSSGPIDVAVDGSFNRALDWSVIGIELKPAGIGDPTN